MEFPLAQTKTHGWNYVWYNDEFGGLDLRLNKKKTLQRSCDAFQESLSYTKNDLRREVGKWRNEEEECCKNEGNWYLMETWVGLQGHYDYEKMKGLIF